jgi:HK97 family phage portal protein
MSLFGRRPAPAEERSTVNLSQYAHLWQSQWAGTYSPIPVGVQNALTHAASSACIDTLATSVSTLPIDTVRYIGTMRRRENPPSLIAQPSALVEPDVWMYQLVDSMLTDGNGFGFIQAVDNLARPTFIELIDPADVVNRRVERGVPTVTIAGDGDHLLYPYGDVWHIPGKYVRAGSPFAESPVKRASATIGAALAAREFGGRFFGDGGHPGGLITSTQDLTADQAGAIKRAWLNAVSGNREPAVLGAGLTYQPLMVNANDSQFIDLMRFAIEEACRFWRVPPSMVYAAISGQNVTYANVSQADLHYLKHSLEGLLRRIEGALTKLIVRPLHVKFNRNAFLSSDPEARWKVHDLRLKNRTMSVNEVRALEDEEPYADPAFDEPGIPGGMTDAPPEGTTPNE